MLISVYIYHELRYDDYHQHANRLYQLDGSMTINGKKENRATASGPMGKSMKMEFPEIEEQARLLQLFLDDKTLIQYTPQQSDVKSFYETKGFLADSTFFRLLTYSFKEGNPVTALNEPNTVVINEEIARKLFGKEPALNKIIKISSSTNGDHDCRITGVFKPNAGPSHIDARFIISFKGGDMDKFANVNPSMINNNMFFTYLLLKDGADPKKLEAKFPAFIEKHIGKELRSMGRDRAHYLTNIKRVHLYSGTVSNVTPPGSVTSLFILGSIAFLTLLIACINFMNLATSSSSKRASEVGVRKVLGAERSSLLKQFLGESVLMTFIAFLFACAFTFLLLPLFEMVSGRELKVTFAQHAPLFAVFIVLSLLTGLLAGSYPAFYLSSFIPVKVLKGKFKNSLAAVSLRKGLVVFQFVISIALIVASVVIATQMKYMRSKDLGFTKDQQVIIPLRTSTAKSIYPSMKTEARNLPNISSVGASLYYPGIFNPMDWLFFKEGQTQQDSKQVFMNFVDDNYLNTLNIKPVAGRLFSKDFMADTTDAIIVNEEAIRTLGFKSSSDAIGKWVGFNPSDSTYKFTIVGVVKDFHFEDLHMPIKPYGFLLNSNNEFNYIVAHASKNDIAGTLKSLGDAWHKLNPNEPFEYSFLDQDFQKNYEAEQRQAALINYFTIIAIIISCLGLFGLASFSAEQRTKEIGIRKVLGASVASVVTLISKDFIKLILVAIVIASPVAWYMMNKWLENFNYRITIGWQVFVLTSILAVAIALFTISFQAIKAAISNPVKNLRTE
jgi:putative ABC transport system permease protein